MSNFHKEKEKFLQAIRFTASKTGFSEVLIEKDYYCSLILKEIFQSKDCLLVFKGGTLLNKILMFYRLSEDLDFSIHDVETFSRNTRSNIAKMTKRCVSEVVKKLSLDFSKPFEGHNENRSYNAEVEYDSVIAENKSTIKIEFGIQEKIWERESFRAKTLLMDSITQKPVLSDFRVTGLSLKEAYSEKIRAALSRRKPAIRDIFDIYYALKTSFINERRGLIKIHDISPMVKYKLKTLNRTIDLSDERKKDFLSQLQTDLKPVLRQKDFEDFDFEKAWSWLKNLEQEISKSL